MHPTLYVSTMYQEQLKIEMSGMPETHVHCTGTCTMHMYSGSGSYLAPITPALYRNLSLLKKNEFNTSLSSINTIHFPFLLTPTFSPYQKFYEMKKNYFLSTKFRFGAVPIDIGANCLLVKIPVNEE